MNIFEYHLKEIHNLILIKKDFLKLDKIENLGKINLEVPPEHFNFDLSCNIAMVLGKSNKLAPKKLAEKIRELFLDQIKNFSNVEIAGPGFLNIKLSKSALIENINSILKNNENYGSNKTRLSALVGRLSSRLVHIQTGYVYHYAFAMMIGVVVLLSWYFSGFGR